MKYKKRKSYYYYRKQRRLGVALLVLAVLSAIITGGEITVALLTAPLGAYLIFTKDRIILDDYFYEMEDKDLNEEERL